MVYSRYLFTLTPFHYIYIPSITISNLINYWSNWKNKEYNWTYWFSLENGNWRIFHRTYLTGFVTTLAISVAWPITKNPRLLHLLMLAIYSSQLSSVYYTFISYAGTGINFCSPTSIRTEGGGGKDVSIWPQYTASNSIFPLIGALSIGL